MGTLIECFYLFIFAQSFHGLPFQTFLVDHHCPLSHFWDRLALFFASWFWCQTFEKSVLWKLLSKLPTIWLPSQRLRTICLIAIGNCKRLAYFLSIVLLIFQFIEILKWLISNLEMICFRPCWRIWKGRALYLYGVFHHWWRHHVGRDISHLGGEG